MPHNLTIKCHNKHLNNSLTVRIQIMPKKTLVLIRRLKTSSSLFNNSKTRYLRFQFSYRICKNKNKKRQFKTTNFSRLMLILLPLLKLCSSLCKQVIIYLKIAKMLDIFQLGCILRSFKELMVFNLNNILWNIQLIFSLLIEICHKRFSKQVQKREKLEILMPFKHRRRVLVKFYSVKSL